MWKNFHAKYSYGVMAGFVLACIVGIGFRTYHFHDQLRFNADQSRDAALVSAVVSEGESWPLLGPKAGGTDFKLGPIFYHFQIIAAEIFGDAPEVMAYPDVLFSLLFIPIFFVFLRTYFDKKISYALILLLIVSAYFTKYARFAWNPNSTPFWSTLFLLGLHRVVTVTETRQRWLWVIVTGVAIGVGVQLHTMLLLFFPLVTLVIGGLAFWRQDRSLWKQLLAIVVLAVGINAPQILSEYQTGGQNTQAFFESIGTKGGRESSMTQALWKNVVCAGQASVYMLSGQEVSDNCHFKGNGIMTIAGIIFVLGGGCFGVLAWRRERDRSRAYCIGVSLVYMTVAGMIFIPLAEEISMRFYLCLAFFPGVLFGWWWVQMRFWLGQKWVDRAMFIVVGVLVLSNSWSVIATLRTQDRFLQITDQKSGSFDFVTLGEVERIVRFMDSRTDSSTVILQGNAQVLFKSGKSIAFIAKQSDLMVDLKGKAFAPGVPIFFIETTNKQKASSNTNPALSSDREIIGRLSISRVHIP